MRKFDIPVQNWKMEHSDWVSSKEREEIYEVFDRFSLKLEEFSKGFKSQIYWLKSFKSQHNGEGIFLNCGGNPLISEGKVFFIKFQL